MECLKVNSISCVFAATEEETVAFEATEPYLKLLVKAQEESQRSRSEIENVVSAKETIFVKGKLTVSF